MSAPPTSEPPPLPPEDLAAELRRLAARLRTAPPARLALHAAEIRELLQQLADLAAALEPPASGSAGPPRRVPVLPDGALGDQLDVLAADALQALRDRPDAANATGPAGLLDAARATLRTLRREL